MCASFPLRVVRVVALASLASTLVACFGPPPETVVGPPPSTPLVAAKGKAGACVIAPHTICANLSLAGLNFAQAKLRNADFHGADLAGADLREADLRYADLADANLAGANLEGARLDAANLSGANLSKTDLSRVSLAGATVDPGTSFTDSYRCETTTPEDEVDNTGCPGGAEAQGASPA